MENKYNELEKLNQLKSNGTITNAEFEVEKHKILNSTNNKSKKTVGIIAKCFFVVGCIVLIITIISGIKSGNYYNWTAGSDSTALMLKDRNEYRSLVEKGENIQDIAKLSLIITDVTFVIAIVCQFISNNKNRKKVIILIAEIFIILIITLVDYFLIAKL